MWLMVVSISFQKLGLQDESNFSRGLVRLDRKFHQTLKERLKSVIDIVHLLR